MCLITKSYKTKKQLKTLIKRATEDIVVYKGLDEGNKSPYQHMRYERGYHYTEGRSLKYRISGMYSYNLRCDEGLHANITRHAAKQHGLFTRKMIIPKGAQYILGINNDIITTDLIWR